MAEPVHHNGRTIRWGTKVPDGSDEETRRRLRPRCNSLPTVLDVLAVLPIPSSKVT